MRKFLKVAQSRVARSAAVVGGLALAGIQSANAAIDISAETASAKTDISTAGGLIIGVVVACAVFGWVRRVIK